MVTDVPLFLLGAVLLVVGVAPWVWFVRRWLRRRHQLRTWPRVTARFYEARRTRETVRIPDSGSRTYTVVHGDYVFTDPSGRPRSGTHRAAPSKVASHRVEVMYDPADPARHEPVAKRPLWAELLAVVPISVLALGFGIPCLFLGLGFE